MLQGKRKIFGLLCLSISVSLFGNPWRYNPPKRCVPDVSREIVTRNINQVSPQRISIGGIKNSAEEYISLVGATPVSTDLNYAFEQGFEKVIVSKFSQNSSTQEITRTGYSELEFGLEDIVPLHPGAIVCSGTLEGEATNDTYYVIGSHAPYYDEIAEENVPSRFIIAKLSQDLLQDNSYNMSQSTIDFPLDRQPASGFPENTYYMVNTAKMAGNKVYMVGTIRDYDLDDSFKKRSFIACYNVKDCVWIIKPQIIEDSVEDLELINLIFDVEPDNTGNTCNIVQTTPSYMYVSGSKGTQGIVGKFLISAGQFELQDSGVTQQFTATGFYEDGATENSRIWDMQYITDEESDKSYLITVSSEVEYTLPYLQSITVSKIKAETGVLDSTFGKPIATPCGEEKAGYQKHYFDDITLQYPFSFRLKDNAWIANNARHSVHVTSKGDIFAVGSFANYVMPFVYKLTDEGKEKNFKKVFRYSADESDEPVAVIDASPLYYPFLAREWGSELEILTTTILTDDLTLHAIGTQGRAYRFEGDATVHETRANEEYGDLGVLEVDEGADIVREIDLSRSIPVDVEFGDGIKVSGICHYDSARSVITFTDIAVPPVEGIEDVTNISLSFTENAIQHNTFPSEITVGLLYVNAELSLTIEEQKNVTVPLTGIMSLRFSRRKLISIDELMLTGSNEHANVTVRINQFEIPNIFNQITHGSRTIMDHLEDLFFNE